MLSQLRYLFGAGPISTAEQASRISAIKELFPSYGDGFLAACLEVFGRDPEKVINGLLEGSLPMQLSGLDTSMPLQAPALQAAKGKGKARTEGSCSMLLESGPSSGASANVSACVRLRIWGAML